MFAKNEQFPKIEAILKNYFDGYLKADPETLAKAFYKEARLFSTDEEKLSQTEMSEWIKNLEERRVKKDIRQADAQIIGIDVSGGVGVAKVKLTFLKFAFTDYLSLVQVDGNWIIVSKIYSVLHFGEQ